MRLLRKSIQGKKELGQEVESWRTSTFKINRRRGHWAGRNR